MTGERDLLADTTEDFFEDGPCGHLATKPDGTLVRVNGVFEAWTGLTRSELVGARRFQDLLSPGGRIYYETHYAPLLHMQGSVHGIAVEIMRADGSRMPALVSSVLRRWSDYMPREVWTSVFEATDRREYEAELLRARRREHEIAARLQRSMLSGTVSRLDGCEIEAAYRPAVRGMSVGGDWYDAFRLDDREAVGVVVGDVVGHGVEAAATMGQLRSAVRALALTGLSPAAVLTRLDEYARRHGVGKMCTVAYAELAPSTGLLRFACAGHPPPLVAPPDEDARFAWDGRSTPLAAFLDAGPRPEATETLAPGTAVLLYSDGIFEDRSRSLDEGLERVRRTVAAHRSEPSASILDRLIGGVGELDRADDMCALLARLTPTAEDATEGDPRT